MAESTDDAQVTILTQGGEEHQIETPLSIRASEFISELVTALKLPISNADGQVINWRVDNKDTGHTLEGERTLGENGVQAGHRLSLIREVVAGAFNPRDARLRKEWEGLQQLNKESDTVRVDPIELLPGSPPEKYRVTFRCKGITGIGSDLWPIYGEKHQVLMLCDEDFPAEPPRLRWETDIWHPNIQHAGSKGVCVNRPEWVGGMTLVDLCRQLFEMVQYKNYHAAPTKPGPLDGEVAQWVLAFAETKRIVNKSAGVSVDDKPFTRPTATRYVKLAPVRPTPPAQPRVKLKTNARSEQTIQAADGAAATTVVAPPDAPDQSAPDRGRIRIRKPR